MVPNKKKAKVKPGQPTNAHCPSDQASCRELDGGKDTKVALTVVGGSVEEERAFSAMEFLKSRTRNSLQEDHLNCAMRAFTMRHPFPADAFPFEEAFRVRTEQCPRRAVLA
jgi:hypothetical protein